MSATLISTNSYKARKKHLCELCGQQIGIGYTYTRQFVTQEGNAYAFKMHQVCEDIANHYSSEYDYYDDGYDSNCFSNDVLENFKEITGVERNGLPYNEAVELFKESWMLKARKEIKL